MSVITVALRLRESVARLWRRRAASTWRCTAGWSEARTKKSQRRLSGSTGSPLGRSRRRSPFRRRPQGRSRGRARRLWRLLLLLPQQLGRRALLDLEAQLVAVHVHRDLVAGLDAAVEHQPRELVLDQPLDGAPQRARPVLGVVALAREQSHRLLRELDLDPLRPQPATEPVEQEPCDLQELLLGERAEDDDLVDPVDELRPEAAAQAIHQLVLELVEVATLPGEVLDPVGADVRGHDH